MKNFFIALTRNPLSLVGAAITTAAAALFATLFVLDLVGMKGGPYVGIIAYLIVPAIFVLGLLLIPIGIARERKRERAATGARRGGAGFPGARLQPGGDAQPLPRLLRPDDRQRRDPRGRDLQGRSMMESTEFCGEACHTVMAPEHTAYQRGAHASVRCVECHIGPGAGWFVKSKLSGSWQLVSVALDSTRCRSRRRSTTCARRARPASSATGRRSSSATSSRCIDQVRGRRGQHRAEDGAAACASAASQGRASKGIHWHVDPANRISYRSDETREEICEVELHQRPTAKSSAELAADGAGEGEKAAGGVWRDDGLRRLPQPAQPHVPARPRTRSTGRSATGGSPRPAVRPQRGPPAAQGRVRRATRRARRAIPAGLAGLLRPGTRSSPTKPRPRSRRAAAALDAVYRRTSSRT